MYTVADFVEDLNNPYTFPGAYPKYFVTSDGGALSYDAAKERKEEIIDSITNDIRDGWKVIGCAVNLESELYCDHTGEKIESAYG